MIGADVFGRPGDDAHQLFPHRVAGFADLVFRDFNGLGRQVIPVKLPGIVKQSGVAFPAYPVDDGVDRLCILFIIIGASF